jgi:hypothetical protein
MQMKKNSRRRHDERVSRAAIRRTNITGHARAPARRRSPDREPVGVPSLQRVLDDASVAHHQPGVGDRRQLRVVRDQDDGRPTAMVNLAQQLEDVTAVRAVQVAGRLVGEHDRRVVGEGAGERHALLLAARQL